MVKSVLLKDYCFSNCCYLSCITRQYKVVNFDYIPSNLAVVHVVGNIILFLDFSLGGCGCAESRGRPIRILTRAKNILEQTKLPKE